MIMLPGRSATASSTPARELGVAEIAERKVEPCLDLAIGILGQTDGAGRRDVLQTRGDVDAVTHEVAIAFLDHVAQMYPNPKLNAAVLGHPGVALDHAILHFHGAAHRFYHAAELRCERRWSDRSGRCAVPATLPKYGLHPRSPSGCNQPHLRPGSQLACASRSQDHLLVSTITGRHREEEIFGVPLPDGISLRELRLASDNAKETIYTRGHSLPGARRHCPGWSMLHYRTKSFAATSLAGVGAGPGTLKRQH